MLRDRNLIPLSHQHQHALALCVKMDRAAMTEAAIADFNKEIEQIWRAELRWHFAAEEEALFPEAENVQSLRATVKELVEEHAVLRGMVEQVMEKPLTATGLKVFSSVLSAHIRKEERELFEGMQRAIGEEDLKRIGERLTELLARAPGASCGIGEANTVPGEQT